MLSASNRTGRVCSAELDVPKRQMKQRLSPPRCKILQRWRRLCNRGILRCFSKPLDCRVLFCNALISHSEGGLKRPSAAQLLVDSLQTGLFVVELVEFEQTEQVDRRIECIQARRSSLASTWTLQLHQVTYKPVFFNHCATAH